MALADLLSSGSAFIKWSTPGRTVTGTIVRLEERQARVFGGTDLDTWPDGNPKMQYVFTLHTAERDPEDADDDGTRKVVFNAWGDQNHALRTAVQALGRIPADGDQMTVTHTTGQGGASDPRKFTVTFVAGAPAGIAAMAPAAAAPAAAAPAAAPASDASPATQAKELLAAGLDVPAVAEATGLSATTVQALANTLK